jgi:hypothetical protein
VLLKIHTVSNPTLDSNGRFTETFNEFEKLVNAVVSGSDGYVPHIYSLSGNIVTVEVRRTAALTHTGTAVADHPAHLHNLKFKDADVTDGANTRVNVGSDKIGANTGADITVTSTDGVRGVQNAAAMTHIVTQPSDHAAGVLAALGAGAITATFRIIAEGI